MDEINAEREKSDRLTVAKLNAVKQFNKQDYKSKLMTEKYSLLPLNPQQLTPVQTAIQRMSEKHPDFEIEPVNTIRPPGIEYTQMPQALIPIDTPLSIIRKHIPRQFDIDKIVKNIETHVIHSLELLIQAQDLIKAYQYSTLFHDIYQYITDGKLPSSTKVQNYIRAKALNYVIIKIQNRLECKINYTLPALLPNKINTMQLGLVTSGEGIRNKRAIPTLAIIQGVAAIGGMMIKRINALVDAKRASSFNNAIKLINENVQITHDRLITLENRTAMMAKAIIPVLKDFKQQINNTNDRLNRQY